ncbi:MAG TPA: GxxExxY protein [Verrucomicrobiae bacterium]|nr:GxxExxY protein [Verrucomicrobiae bacterium]
MVELILKNEVYAIVGAAMEAHREKGFGFAEPVYQECMEIELSYRKIPALAQKEMPIHGIESVDFHPKSKRNLRKFA